MSDEHPFRLPRTVIPEHYHLTITPNLDAATFGGTARITVMVHEPTDVVVLNAAELEIGTVVVTASDGARDVVSIALEEVTERLTLTLARPLPPGPAEITIGFVGILNDRLRGFYRSTYQDEEGATQVIATTQFESTNARRAFPCWDEPDLKATFAVTLVVPEALLAVSSGPEIERTDLGSGLHQVVFGTTMRMSTYLLAFIVGPLVATDPIDVDGVALRIIHSPDKAHLTALAADVGAFSLRLFNDYFAIPYPDPKLDLVGVPDFAFGAMENQACATFRELRLLIDPDTAPLPDLMATVDVIIHEIAHMWFGNLVTMRWWNGIWLKEAFATFCETMGTDRYRPDWQRWVSFGASRAAALEVDALDTTRPIEFDVVSPDDAEAMYDVLTYEKGGAVVRMVEQYLGPDRFRAGVRHYLATYAGSNTDNRDLWDSIGEVTGEPLGDVMDTWIFQGGFPLVTVSAGTQGGLRLTQHRFRHHQHGDDGTRWQIPMVLSMSIGGDVTQRPVLFTADTLDIETDGPVDWVVANAGGAGFYRCRYSADLFDALVGVAGNLAPIERFGLVDDTWAGVVAGDIAVGRFVDLVEALVGAETDLTVWEGIAGGLGEIDDHLADDEAGAAFRGRIVGFATATLETIGTVPASDDDDRTNRLRALLLRLAGAAGDPDTIAWARQALPGDDLDPERRAAAETIVASHGDAADFDRVLDALERAGDPQTERRHLLSLADFPGPAEVDRFLAMVAAHEVRSQDAPFVLARALRNRSSGPRVWAHIEDSWDDLTEYFAHNGTIRMVAGVPALADPELAARVRTFFETHPLPQAGKTLDQYLERLDLGVDLRRRVRAELR